MGISGSSQEHAGTEGEHAWSLTPCHQQDLVVTQCRNSPEWSKMSQSMHWHMGKEAEGIQLASIQELPGVHL